MPPAGFYAEGLESLEMYQRLIQYWWFLFDKRNELSILDNMNFSLTLYPEILKVSEIYQLHALEPGYTSPDGSSELGAIIRRLEFLRLQRHSPHRTTVNQAIVNQAGLGCGNGSSNAMHAVLQAVCKLHNDTFPRANDHPEIILTLPNYTVYAGQASQMRPQVEPRFVIAKREDGFLPTFHDIANAVTPRTIAVIVTYPNNPAQSTYEGKRLDELRQLVRFCQSEGIFLIVDNIYQDLLHGEGRQFEEVFALTESVDFVIKIYGHSKDMPFFCGYRTGYWFGDPRIEDAYRYAISTGENSMNLVSLCMFGVSLLIRSLLLSGEKLTVDHMAFLEGGMFGWSQKIDRRECFEKFEAIALVENYRTRLVESNKIQRDAVCLVRDFVRSSKCFSDFCNEDIGNVCFLRIDPHYFGGTDAELFDYLFVRRIGVLPGNVFGMPIVAGDVWFRMTLVHDSASNLVRYLETIDKLLGTPG